MLRRVRTVTPKSHSPRSAALWTGALVGALLLLGGCIGGAQPVPPALEPDPMFSADAGADGSRGFFGDAGASASDAGPTPPPDNDSLADFAGERSATPNVVDPATDDDWRWYPFQPAPYFRDAGAPVADDLGPGDESVDAQ